jgi:hypothetical protein
VFKEGFLEGDTLINPSRMRRCQTPGKPPQCSWSKGWEVETSLGVGETESVAGQKTHEEMLTISSNKGNAN